MGKDGRGIDWGRCDLNSRLKSPECPLVLRISSHARSYILRICLDLETPSCCASRDYRKPAEAETLEESITYIRSQHSFRPMEELVLPSRDNGHVVVRQEVLRAEWLGLYEALPVPRCGF